MLCGLALARARYSPSVFRPVPGLTTSTCGLTTALMMGVKAFCVS